MLYLLSKPPGHYKPLAITFTLLSIAFSLVLRAQTADANNVLNQANTMVRSYYEPATNLMYAIGAILGLLGAIKVFRSSIDQRGGDVGSHAGIWFGACIFLVVASTVIKAFFGM